MMSFQKKISFKLFKPFELFKQLLYYHAGTSGDMDLMRSTIAGRTLRT
jgi:hypothetical protein